MNPFVCTLCLLGESLFYRRNGGLYLGRGVVGEAGLFIVDIQFLLLSLCYRSCGKGLFCNWAYWMGCKMVCMFQGNNLATVQTNPRST